MKHEIGQHNDISIALGKLGITLETSEKFSTTYHYPSNENF